MNGDSGGLELPGGEGVLDRGDWELPVFETGLVPADLTGPTSDLMV